MATAVTMLAMIMASPPVIATKDDHEKYRHDGCQSHRCDKRMNRKAHAKTLRHWAKITQPYRGWLRSTRMCESGGNYAINTGNGFYGAYQFVLSTWWAVGGRGYPHQAEPMEQDYRAVMWRKRIGNPHSPAGWPVCG